jgi:photosystem II stability/assembly factor-like uncharacterized protein
MGWRLLLGAATLGLFCWPLAAGENEDEKETAGMKYLEWLLEGRLTPQGAMGSLLDAWRQAQAVPNNNANAYWEPLGPAPLLGGTTRLGGRTNAIAIDPRDPDVIYLGAAMGGVWKTVDGGASWTPLTDDQPSLAMGAIAIDPVNPDIVYAGTGESNFSGDSYYGIGVLRSEDGGATWMQLGGDVFINPAGGGARIARILIDPNAPETIYAGSTYGLYKSADSGQSWELKLSSRTQAAITDLLIHPTNSNVLYAAVSVPNGSNNKGIYRSVDAGETWQQLDIGLASNQIGRINIAIAPSNPLILYASIGNAAGGSVQMFRLKSADGGDTWQQLPSCTASCNQSSYNNIIRVHPENPDIIYQGAVNLFRSTDGGQSWSSTTRGHVDHHWLVFDQLNRLYIGSDGGAFRINTDDGTTDLNTNLATLQFYAGIALHPANDNYILGGTQDNGSEQYTGEPTWHRVCGGDGAYQAIEGLDGDPDNVWYCSSQNLAIRKTRDGGRTTQSATNGLDRANAAFIAPFVIDPNNSQVLITGTRGVWRSENGAGLWQRNSPADLSPSTIRCLAFAPSDSNTYYAGATGRIFRTTDAGQSWTLVSSGIPNAVVTHIAVSPLDSNTVYATVTGFGTGHVFRGNDAGNSWTDISGNLPNVPATALLYDATGNAPVLYVGTDIGVFRSLDDGASWERFNNGLPTVRVEDLVLNPKTGAIVASTHGRGMWRLNQAFGK